MSEHSSARRETSRRALLIYYTQLASSNRLVEEKAGNLYVVCLLPDAKARRHAGLTEMCIRDRNRTDSASTKATIRDD